MLRPLAAAALFAAAPVGAGAPERIVSINVCADQLVLMLADRARIASLSHLAADPRVSAMADAARGLPRNHGQAEEIVLLKPDLVLASAFAAGPTNALLRRLGYRVVEVPVAGSLDDIEENIALVAGAVGAPGRGRTLAATFAAETAGPARRPETAPMAALYWANGYSSGPGTLANAVVEAAGFRSLGRALGIRGAGVLPLETMLAAAPDFLVLGEGWGGAALAGAARDHPALRRRFPDRRRIALPQRFWLCGTPMVAHAIRRLAGRRASLAGEGMR